MLNPHDHHRLGNQKISPEEGSSRKDYFHSYSDHLNQLLLYEMHSFMFALSTVALVPSRIGLLIRGCLSPFCASELDSQDSSVISDEPMVGLGFTSLVCKTSSSQWNKIRANDLI